MSQLLFTGSLDQALLAMVIEEASQVATEKGGYVGRTAIQKVMYFLKVIGVPMVYRFDIYHYGPFSDSVRRDMEWLLADEVVIDRTKSEGKYSNYAGGPNLPVILTDYKETLEQYRERIRRLCNVIVPLPPDQMELIATLDFLYRKYRASKTSVPLKPKVIEEFERVKAGKFPSDTIQNTYERLVSVGLFEE